MALAVGAGEVLFGLWGCVWEEVRGVGEKTRADLRSLLIASLPGAVCMNTRPLCGVLRNHLAVARRETLNCPVAATLEELEETLWSHRNSSCGLLRFARDCPGAHLMRSSRRHWSLSGGLFRRFIRSRSVVPLRSTEGSKARCVAILKVSFFYTEKLRALPN